MATFTDNHRREWRLYVDVPLAREVRRRTGANILDVRDGLSAVAADPILLVDVLWVLVEEQAHEKHVSDVEFGKALVGRPIEAAGDALVEALTDFSPPRQRKILEAMTATTRQFQETLLGLAQTKIPPALAELKRLTPGATSPASAGSPDSIPDRA